MAFGHLATQFSGSAQKSQAFLPFLPATEKQIFFLSFLRMRNANPGKQAAAGTGANIKSKCVRFELSFIMSISMVLQIVYWPRYWSNPCSCRITKVH
jgi:hypothetical protein